MRVNISVKKYRMSIKLFIYSYLIAFIPFLITVIAINDLRDQWVMYLAVLIGSLILPGIVLGTYHTFYYKRKLI